MDGQGPEHIGGGEVIEEDNQLRPDVGDTHRHQSLTQAQPLPGCPHQGLLQGLRADAIFPGGNLAKAFRVARRVPANPWEVSGGARR